MKALVVRLVVLLAAALALTACKDRDDVHFVPPGTATPSSWVGPSK